MNKINTHTKAIVKVMIHDVVDNEIRLLRKHEVLKTNVRHSILFASYTIYLMTNEHEQ